MSDLAVEDQSYEERMAARAERRKMRQAGGEEPATPPPSTASAGGAPSATASATASPSKVTTGYSSMRVSGSQGDRKSIVSDNRKSMFEKPADQTTTPVITGSVSKRTSIAIVSEKCDVCTKTVYPLEKIEADGKKYHKTCFKCEQCKKTLSLGTYAALQGKFYCKPHFKQLFRLKGNYDEGFGRSMRKHDWVYKEGEDGSTPSSSTPPTPADTPQPAEDKAAKLKNMFAPPEPAKPAKEEAEERKEPEEEPEQRKEPEEEETERRQPEETERRQPEEDE